MIYYPTCWIYVNGKGTFSQLVKKVKLISVLQVYNSIIEVVNAAEILWHALQVNVSGGHVSVTMSRAVAAAAARHIPASHAPSAQCVHIFCHSHLRPIHTENSFKTRNKSIVPSRTMHTGRILSPERLLRGWVVIISGTERNVSFRILPEYDNLRNGTGSVSAFTGIV